LSVVTAAHCLLVTHTPWWPWLHWTGIQMDHQRRHSASTNYHRTSAGLQK